MLIYRIAASKYIEDLSGAGSKQYGGRWNDKGVAMVYFAQSRAMAVMELLVHLRPEEIDRDFILAVFEVSDASVLTIDSNDLPKNWKDKSEVETLKEIGNKFIKSNQYLLMKVPSVIIEEEFNFIFNPNHAAADTIKLVEKRVFKFDTRFKH